jgi:ribosomal protein L37AE/L43A
MYQKMCPECRVNSYSSSNRGQWNCPSCGTDMTNEPTTAAFSGKKGLFQRSDDEERKGE